MITPQHFARGSRGLRFMAAFVCGLAVLCGRGVAATLTLTNLSPVSIPTLGNATPYPSLLTVSNAPGVVTKVTVTLRKFTHIWPDDVDVLLVGPAGQAVLLLSDAGGSSSVTDLTLTFDDAAAGLLPNSTVLTSGTYRPSDYAPVDQFPGVPFPFTNVLSAFNGTDPNGSWLLHVLDDEAPDGGSIAGGWTLNIEYAPPLAELPRQDFWVPDGPVYALAQQGNNLYLGGSFNYLRPNRTPGVAFDTDTLQADLTFPEINGEVYAVVRDSGGGFYIGGEFTMAGGVAVSNLAYIGPDRQVVAEWQPHANGIVRALAFADGRLFVGGDFTVIAGQSIAYLAELNGATGEATNLVFSVNGPVTTLAVSMNTLYAAGSFANANGQFRPGLAAFDLFDGGLLPWNPNPLGGTVKAFALNGDTLYVGGTFTNIGGQLRQKLAALDIHTGLATPWPTGTNSSITSINALALAGGALHVGGDFTQLYGTARRALAALDPVQGTNTAWNPGLSNGVVNALAVSGSTIFAGGSFTNVGAQIRRGLAAIDVATGLARAWNVESSGEVRSLALSFHTVFAVGGVVNNGGLPRRNAAAIDLSTGQPTAWNPEVDGTVLSLLASSTNVVLGGLFTKVGGLVRTNLALVNATAGSVAPGWNPNPNGIVFALAPSPKGPGHVFAGGSFTVVSGQARSRLAEIDPSGLATFWSADANGTVLTLATVSPSTLYAGGVFSTIGVTQRAGLAALDSFSGAVSPWNAGGNGVIYTLASADGLLYVGGSFSQIGGAARTNLAALQESGLAAPWNPGANSSVQSLALRGDAVYVGGGFTRVAGQARTNLAAIRIANGALLSWNPKVNGVVNALATAGDLLFASGDFTRNGSQYQSRLAAFPPEGTARVIPDAIHPRVQPGSNVMFSVDAIGAPPLFYQWRYNGIDLAGANAPTFVVSNAQPFNAGEYSVAVSNPWGTVFSAWRLLTVLVAPQILSQSNSLTSSPGKPFTLGVTASGSPTLNYSWRLNGDPMPYEVGPTLTVLNAQPTNGGEYSVFVFNDAGFARSSNMIVTISATPHPFADNFSGRTALIGATGVRQGSSAGATNEPGEPGYPGRTGGKSVWARWTSPNTGVAKFSTRGSAFDTLLSVYTGASLGGLSLVAFDDDSGGYWTSEVQFNAQAGTEYAIRIDGVSEQSGNIVLDWSLEAGAPVIPVITTHPRSIAAAAGSNVQFSVTATANMAGGLRYQWLHESVSIPGATNATLTIVNAQARHVGAYTVLVTNAAGRFARSRPARLGIGVGAFGVDKIEDLPPGEDSPAGFAAGASRTKSTSFTPASTFNPPVYDTNNTYASLISTAGHVGSTDPTPCQTVIYSSIHFGPFSVDDDAVVTVDTVGATFRSVLAAYAGLRTVSGTTTNYSYFRTLLSCDKSTSALDFNQRVIFNAAPGASNIYTVLADGLDGAVANLQLSVNIRSRRPVILQPPVSTVTTQGMSAEFSVAVAGVGPFSYQWFSNGTAIAGAVLDRLLLQNVTPNFASADFSVRVTNTFAMTTSPPVRVTVLVPPSVTVAPAAVFTNRLSTVVFAAQAQGTPPPILRWLFTPVGGTPTLLTGENSATLQRNAVNDPHAGTYTVQASNTVGIASASATLVVGDAPQFVLQPAPARVRFGTSVQFSAVAGGTPPIDYLWRKDPGTVVQSWTRHGSNYVIGAAAITHAGSYRVVASNAFGTVTSSNASLVVAYPLLLDYRVSHATNGMGNSQQIFDWLELIVSNSWPGVSNVFVLEGTDQPANAQWNPILTNTQPINPLVITQQMNLTNRVFQFYRVNPPP